MVAIDAPAETVVFSSDVQGPVVAESAKWIRDQDPDLVLLDGPPTYLSEETFDTSAREAARENMQGLAKVAPLVIDHHLVRSTGFRTFVEPVMAEAAEADHLVETAAAFAGQSERCLERKREALHEADPVSEEFYDDVEAGHFVENPIPES